MNEKIESIQKKLMKRLGIPLLFITSSLAGSLISLHIFFNEIWAVIDTRQPGESVGMALMCLSPINCLPGLVVGAVVTFLVWRKIRN